MPPAIWHLLQLARDRRGVAALEFAVILPVLALTLMGVIDLGGAIQQSLRLEAAARAGAQYAMSAPTNSGGIAAAVRSALPGWNDVQVQPTTMTCVCPGSGATSCTSTSCATALQRFVSITVTRSYSALLLPNLTSVRGSMTLRVR
jgi:Flp pilus assembly protein TadG